MGYIEKTYGRSEKFLAFKVCFYDTLVPTREYKSGYAADRFARKCAAQGLWCSLHGLAVADGSCEWVHDVRAGCKELTASLLAGMLGC